jgi:hypothetical protein
VRMLGVTEKSFSHLSGRYDVAGGHPWRMIDRFFARAGRGRGGAWSMRLNSVGSISRAGPAIASHALDADPLASVGSCCILSFGGQRGYATRDIGRHGKPCTGLPSESSALKGTRVQTLPLAPPLSTPQFLADKTSPCYVRSLPDLLDVYPSGKNTVLMMHGFNW